ncbi:MAG: hypothetical protein HYT78_19895 [Deltaproteobacteria bacterium]|nr:hypothetical protein [Deltaproteobacteria bacterium]
MKYLSLGAAVLAALVFLVAVYGKVAGIPMVTLGGLPFSGQGLEQRLIAPEGHGKIGRLPEAGAASRSEVRGPLSVRFLSRLGRKS